MNTYVSGCYLVDEVTPEVHLGLVLQVCIEVRRVSHQLESWPQTKFPQTGEQRVQACEIIRWVSIFRAGGRQKGQAKTVEPAQKNVCM